MLLNQQLTSVILSYLDYGHVNGEAHNYINLFKQKKYYRDVLKNYGKFILKIILKIVFLVKKFWIDIIE